VNRVCVFCGAAAGARPEYAEAARTLASELRRRGLGLVYGGGSTGLMGAVAEAALAAGVEVIGVLPHPLSGREFAHPGLTELRLVSSMHERKATMASLADAFISLPGGLGTLEETLEMLTWTQLGIHRKPLGLLNVAGYWTPLVDLLRHAAHESFIHPNDLATSLIVADTPSHLLDLLASWNPPSLPRAWLSASQT
jgi:uncharacterized protein (TIGR00730 family)